MSQAHLLRRNAQDISRLLTRISALRQSVEGFDGVDRVLWIVDKQPALKLFCAERFGHDVTTRGDRLEQPQVQLQPLVHQARSHSGQLFVALSDQAARRHLVQIDARSRYDHDDDGQRKDGPQQQLHSEATHTF